MYVVCSRDGELLEAGKGEGVTSGIIDEGWLCRTVGRAICIGRFQWKRNGKSFLRGSCFVFMNSHMEKVLLYIHRQPNL